MFYRVFVVQDYVINASCRPERGQRRDVNFVLFFFTMAVILEVARSDVSVFERSIVLRVTFRDLFKRIRVCNRVNKKYE